MKQIFKKILVLSINTFVAFCILSCNNNVFMSNKNIWTQITPKGLVPLARDSAATWSDGKGYVYIFGGFDNMKSGEKELQDMYKYNTAENQWIRIIPEGSLPSARDSAATWNDSLGNLYLFGGYGVEKTELQDMYKYNIAENQWVRIVPDGVLPPARDSAATWTDRSGNFYLFGGRASSNNYLGDMYKYSPVNNQWNKIELQGKSPSARYPGAVWTDKFGSFYLFGGRGQFGYYQDMYKYDPNNNEWNQVITQGMSPPARASTSVWISKSDDLYLFGGHALSGYLQDMYMYDLRENKWHKIVQQGIIPSVRSATSTWTDDSGNFYLFGGFDAEIDLQNMYKYMP